VHHKSNVASFTCGTETLSTTINHKRITCAMSPYITLPPELLMDILADVVEDYTGQPEFCSPAAYHLYDLATACRIFYVLINAMAARKEDVRNDIEHLEKIKSAPNSYCSSLAFSPLSVLCRRIGWFCSFCSNRSRRYADGPQGEIYTGLPVCQACKALIAPAEIEFGLEMRTKGT